MQSIATRNDKRDENVTQTGALLIEFESDVRPGKRTEKNIIKYKGTGVTETINKREPNYRRDPIDQPTRAPRR